jgi:regulator of protease activity HflC (stomatin/prohibitin superfamily)
MNIITILAIVFLSVGLIVAIVRGIQFLVNCFFTITTVEASTVALHYRDGQLIETLKPGRYRFVGPRHEIKHFDTRLQQFNLQTQEVNTAEGISIKATVVGFYKIIDPIKAVEIATDHASTIYTHVQLALRDILNGIEAETLLKGTSQFSSALLEKVSRFSSELGIEFSGVDVRDLILPSEIKASLSEAWRAKKHSLAELEAARGKAAATRTLANAAKLYETNPTLLQVRYLEALETAAGGIGNTFVIGMDNDQALSFKK